MNAPSPTPPAAGCKDRKTGLLLFGIVEILIGCLCVLMVPLMILGQAMAARMEGGSGEYRTMVPGGIVYGVLAVSFVWLGIGSIKARRWARALSLILSWSWLVVGLISLGFFFVLMPEIMRNVPSGAPRLAGMIIAAALLSVIFLIVPGAFVFFYQSRHVKATCEARDPVVRWTDGCPLPVLAVSLWLAFGVLTMLGMPLGYRCVIPCFGTLITGLPGTLLFVSLAALWGSLAWAIYRLKPAAWWILVVLLALFAVSNALTFAQVDLMEMYQLMGYPERQIEQMRKFDFIEGKTMIWWSSVAFVLLLGYLLWVKRFFRSTVSERGQPAVF